jgi:hypothetical protein
MCCIRCTYWKLTFEDIGSTSDSPQPADEGAGGPGTGTNPSRLGGTGSPGEDATSEPGPVSVGGKESRARGVRDEVAERVRLHTDSRATDPSDEENTDGESAPITTSKRKKPPPPPTMYVPPFSTW